VLTENISILIDDLLKDSQILHPDFHQKIVALQKLHIDELREHNRLNALNVEKEKILERQSKMAAMGEMMDAVAHQWKQPLNALSMYADLLQMDFKEGNVDTVYIDELVEDFQKQIQHMVTTIGEFRTFFRPNKEVQPFGMKRCIQSVLLLIYDELLRNNITVHVESKKEIIINGIENEFKHLILNVISNAKDAFIERACAQRNIYIKFSQINGEIIVSIEDNAGGIPPEIIDDIFKPNMTTKRDGEGTGIGLYMSAQIAQKLHGTLTANNTERGACFTLKIPVQSP